MKFLVDNQLPAALAGFLISRGHEAKHVLEFGLSTAKDREIWEYAAKNSCAVISKDEDFSRRTSQPNAKVQVVWVRLGNCRTTTLLAAFEVLLPQMVLALESGDKLIEIR